MKRRILSFRTGPERGVALVIVLAMVVLLTVMVVAFFSRAIIERQVSNSSANTTRADLLAQSASDIIVGDLKQEIVASSSPAPAGGTTIYAPKTPATMLPWRSGIPKSSPAPSATPIPNLVARSVRPSDTGASSKSPYIPYSSDYASPPVNRAADDTTTPANVSTTTPSLNGRSVSLARWNSHYLIPRRTPGASETWNTIYSDPVASFVPPDWVIVTRRGTGLNASVGTINDSMIASLRDSTATNLDYAIGRYAFAIYDEGGLIDINAAGYPFHKIPPSSYSPGIDPTEIARKGNLGFIDLTMVPTAPSVISSTVPATSYLSEGAIDDIIGWRNYATIQPSGNFAGYSFDDWTAFPPSTASRYLNFLRGSTTGFLTVGGTIFGTPSRTDQMFTSRQALLKFRRATSFSQNALQYFTTFSRDLEQPSFVPDPTRPKNTGADLKTSGSTAVGFGGNDAYDPSGLKQNLINPSLLLVRDASGKPVMKRRFPLSRLGLLNEANKTLLTGGTLNSADSGKILNYFGLAWDSTNARWNYNHGDAAKIYKLSELPAQRDGKLAEPDFFETLKAVINCDSLGKQHGGNDGLGSPSRFVNSDIGRDGSVDYQIMQIATNLIDQYDEDSYPTSIVFQSREFHGVENLPYLLGWMSTWYRTQQLTAADILTGYQPPLPAPGKNGFPFETATLLQPIIWNPHAPDTKPSPPNVPTDFKIVAGGVGTGAIPVAIHPNVRSTSSTDPLHSNAVWWSGYDGDPAPLPSKFPIANATNVPVSYVEAQIDPNTNYITFNVTATGPAAFREPYRLHAPLEPSGSNTAAYSDGIINSSDVEEGSFTQALGFYTGRCWTGPSNSAGTSYLNMGALSKSLRLELQYKNPYGSTPAFLTYDVDDYVYTTSSLSSPGNMGIVDSDDSVNTNRGFKTGFRADPRNNRWGNPTLRGAPKWDGRITKPTGTNATSLFGANYYFPYPQGTTIAPTNITPASASAVLYRMVGDNSGGIAKASGWKNIGGAMGPQAPSDVMVNLTKAPGQTIPASQTIVLPGGKTFHTDPDGVLRRSSGSYFTASSSDGLTLETGNTNSRPVILNRPFQSIAEMGYSFRGVAWKDVDFFTPESGDAALLDAFCVNELDNAPETVLVAGRVNLNTRQAPVLKAIISGVSKAEGVSLSSTDADKAAQALVAWTTDTTTKTSTGILKKGPLRNRSELIGKWVSTEGAALTTTAVSSGGNGIKGEDVPNIDGSIGYSGFSSVLTSGAVFASAPDAATKRRRECVMRALADSGNVRTWNLLIDVIAQTGRYPATATDLSKFIVEGEKRYWMHVAIDRYTGEVVASMMESVTE